MAHLSYGLTQGGCFIVLTGEVGTGKTTLCRNLLTELPGNVDVALLLNANINEHELLQSICDELKIEYAKDATQKNLLDSINQHLLKTFAENRHTVLIIDEAQILSRDVLEQIRLLTNLETTKSKLLQIILIGQPELNDVLTRNDLRQLAQRVTARYHLGPLHATEIEDYVNFRLAVAGCKQPLFSRQALSKMHSLTAGIPRKINVLADHALLATYADTAQVVDAKTVKTAAGDVFIEANDRVDKGWLLGVDKKWLLAGAVLLMLNFAFWWAFGHSGDHTENLQVSTSVQTGENTSVEAAASERRDLRESQNQNNLVAENDNGAQTENIGKMIVSEVPLDETPEIPAALADEFIPAVPQAELASTESSQASSKSQAIASESSDTTVVAQTTSEQESDFTLMLEASADQTSRIAAFRKLTSLWSQTLPEQILQPACEELLKLGLRCLGFDNWAQWLRYNRPAVLVVEHEQQLHRVIVRSLQGDVARVLVGESALDVPVAELRARWNGVGVLFWQPPKAGTPLLQMGDSGAAVVATRERLNRALLSTNLPLLASANSTEFDLDMAQKVFALQTRFEIINDSKIGNETWLLLSELETGDQLPILRPRS